MAVVYLGLGSNLGDREHALASACRLLDKHPAIAVQGASSLYETAPVGLAAQGAFLNAVVEVHTHLRPESLLAVTQATESRLGREPGVKWGPRVIDVDILLCGSLRVRRPFLDIPHKSMGERLFVLVPLSELVPELNIPGLGPIAGLVAALADNGGVTRLGAFSPLAEGSPA
jgi:2-amino-4-hydroxy-6-hydroxymethyldihydropteridine diphosphokinase